MRLPAIALPRPFVPAAVRPLAAIQRWRAAPDSSGLLPLVLVLAALVALLVIPVATQRREAAYLNDIAENVDPARQAVSDLEIALAREAAGTRGYLLTVESRYAADHRAARAARERAIGQLRALSTRLGPDVDGRLADLQVRFGAADLLLADLFAGRVTRQQYIALLPLQHQRFMALTAVLAELHTLVEAHAAAQREDVRLAQRIGTLFTIVGVVAAMAAAFAVARLGARHRQLAERERLARVAGEEAHRAAELRREEIERLSQSRARLLRGFSHDLRNPLNAAGGYLNMLENGLLGPLTPKQLHGVGRAHQSIQSAVHLTTDLLELTRAETGTLELRWSQTDLRVAGARAVQENRVLAAGKALVIETESPAEFPVIRSDEVRVRQILGNLISNAIKYTEDGRVEVRIAARRDEDGIECAVVEVHDTGIGIPSESLPHVFDEFYRVHGSSAPGTGVGLAISQRLAHALGGRISVVSGVGHGSTFTLWLPLEPR